MAAAYDSRLDAAYSEDAGEQPLVGTGVNQRENLITLKVALRLVCLPVPELAIEECLQRRRIVAGCKVDLEVLQGHTRETYQVN